MSADETKWVPPVYLYQAGRHCIDSRDYYSEPSSRHLLLRRILLQRSIEGEGVVFGEGKTFAVPAGSMFVIERPGPYGYCYDGDGTPWEVEYTSICCDTSPPLLPREFSDYPIFPIKDYPLLAKEMSELVGMYNAGANPLSMAEKSYRLILGVIHSLQSGRSENPLAESMREAIEEEFDTDLSFADLARRFDVAHETMIRIFKRVHGMTPGQYLLGVRVRHARRFLSQTREPIKHIASLCGFSTANYFGRVFKDETGCTPAQYRRNPDPLS
ncbi:MAG: helix-turn-helix transcriptional regulator [Planctomycetes bacterium]|nr:helix-turn-helix transcriptional regulator [Planctomycetota bacterium]